MMRLVAVIVTAVLHHPISTEIDVTAIADIPSAAGTGKCSITSIEFLLMTTTSVGRPTLSTYGAETAVSSSR